MLEAISSTTRGSLLCFGFEMKNCCDALLLLLLLLQLLLLHL